MKKAILLTFIFLAVIGSAFALTGNTSDYYVQSDFVQLGDTGNTTEIDMYYIITEEPVQVAGYYDGQYSFVGFFPMQDNYTYYVPFSNGSMIFHCNPDNVVLDGSVICTASIVDDDGFAIENAFVNWELFNYNDVLFDSGVFIEIGNGAYKFQADLSQADNYTTGDYYFKFSATGLKSDYVFPVFLSVTYLQENLVVVFSLIMLIVAISTIIYGYGRKTMSFVVFGAFALMLIGMLLFQEPILFGPAISNAFGIIFSLLGLLFLIQMFLEKWQDRRQEQKENKGKRIDIM